MFALSAAPLTALLQTSKLLNYLDSAFTGPYFGMFICIWIYLRHYINLKILASLLPVFSFTLLGRTFETGQFSTVGDYELNWTTQQYKCWIAQVIAFFLLAGLQAINLFWVALLLRIMFRYIRKGEQKDERSDYEEDEEEVVVDDATAPVAVDAGTKANGQPMKPQVLLNGQPVPHMDDSVASGKEQTSRETVRRSSRKR